MQTMGAVVSLGCISICVALSLTLGPLCMISASKAGTGLSWGLGLGLSGLPAAPLSTSSHREIVKNTF